MPTTPSNASGGSSPFSPPITVSDTPAAGEVLTATSASTAAWSAPASGTPRLLPISDVPTILATSAAGHFERHPMLPSVIRAKGLGFGTIADAKANVPTTWTLTNGSGIGSASATNGKLQAVHANSGTDNFYGGTGTAPYYQRSFTRPVGVRFGCVFRFSAADMSASNAGARVGFATAGTPIAMVYFYNLQFRTLINSSTQGAIFTFADAAAQAAGVWVNIEIGPAGDIEISYVQSSSDTEPTTGWAVALRGTLTSTATTWLEVFTVVREGGAGTPTAEIYGYRTYCDTAPSVIPAQGALNGTGFAAVSDAVILADIDYGAAGGLPDQATLRLMLADAVNRIPGDTAAWTFSATGSDSANPAAATTYQSAAALVLKVPSSDTTLSTAKQYWRVRAICTSAGSVLPGSFDLARFPGVYAAAT